MELRLWEKLKPVPGRLETVDVTKNPMFAARIRLRRTPSKRRLSFARAILPRICGWSLAAAVTATAASGRLWRPWRKKHADHVVITSDNPRTTEDPIRIIDEICGASSIELSLHRPDRTSAIERALSSAAAHDTVVIAGKGHETYQIIGRYDSFDDREVVHNIYAKAVNRDAEGLNDADASDYTRWLTNDVGVKKMPALARCLTSTVFQPTAATSDLDNGSSPSWVRFSMATKIRRSSSEARGCRRLFMRDAPSTRSLKIFSSKDLR